MDLNGDGNITTTELAFANATTADDTDMEAFQALYDTNDDNVFNSLDKQWGKARVWQDKDQDGTVDAGELLTLAQAGLTRIGLVTDHKQQTTDGNTVFDIAKADLANGSTINVARAPIVAHLRAA